MNQVAMDELWRNWLGAPRAESYFRVNSELTLEELATWNQKLTASLLFDISHIELAIRNLMNEALQKRSQTRGHDAHWLIDSSGYFSETGGREYRRMLDEAKQRVGRSKDQYSWNDIVADLSLGFWLSFLGKKYLAIHGDLLSAFFGLKDRNIRRVRPLADRLRTLRNRPAHQHRVIHRNLHRDWQDLITLANLIHPELARYLNENSETPRLIEDFSQIVQARS